ncbi:hypothetical protein K525DRAFT_201481 [Schizophyllum commune Loenen D]|nr:hypothetical protein K525DRAFT_201481 [Schizophyllum commune Loenen D]
MILFLTSQILLLSDVDTTEHLSKHGISVVQHILAIGDRLVDHPIVDLHFKRKRNDSLKYYFLPSSVGEVFQLLPDAVRYALFGDGPMATNVTFLATPLAYRQHANLKEMFYVHTYGVRCYILRYVPVQLPQLPRSNGYLKDPRDVHTLRRSVRLLLRVAQTPPISDALDGECSRADLDHRLHELSDEELDEVIRQRCETVYHPACTCRMAPDRALDNRMRVHGVAYGESRVTSALPAVCRIKVLTTIEAGACFAIAEKLADDLKAEYVVSRGASLVSGL